MFKVSELLTVKQVRTHDKPRNQQTLLTSACAVDGYFMFLGIAETLIRHARGAG